MKMPLFRAIELLIILVIGLFVFGNLTFLAGEKNEKKEFQVTTLVKTKQPNPIFHGYLYIVRHR